jgi:carotenoid cleavage dioxygenase-like enzyme
MKKNNLDSIGFTNFNWIKSRFSAHYKCDPENGDIFNIGLNAPFTKIMKCNKNM